jgi:SpoVK/Ycf46/Vps4 family AAA+-type ATPase
MVPYQADQVDSQALAQKLSIQLGRRFSQAKLVEVDCHSLFSKWFSESGKLVGQLFNQIETILEDEDCLVCVIIDEIESLVAQRHASFSSNEPTDGLRVSN